MSHAEATGDLRAILVLLRGRPDIRIDVHDAHPALLLAAMEAGGEYGEGRTSCWVTVERRLTLFARDNYDAKEVA